MAFVAVGAAHAAGNLAFCPDGPALLSRVEVPDAVAIHGFDQLKNIREYMFEDVAAGEAATLRGERRPGAVCKVPRWLAGRRLCLKKLSANLETLQPLPRELTSGDLAAYASAQAAAKGRKTTLRKPRGTYRIIETLPSG